MMDYITLGAFSFFAGFVVCYLFDHEFKEIDTLSDF